MLKSLFLASMFVISCASRHNGDNNGCFNVNYLDSGEHFKIVQKFVYDTTASMVQARFIDAQTEKSISGAHMQIVRNNETIKVSSNEAGVAEVFQNGIEGQWDIIFSAPGYVCLIVKGFVVGGGQVVSVKLGKL